MMILYNAGVALLTGLILAGVLGLEVFRTLQQSRVRVPVERRHANDDLSQRFYPRGRGTRRR